MTCCTTARRLLAAALLALLSAACSGGDDGASADGGPASDGGATAPDPDARPVGPVVDCSADHQESAEATNDPVTVDGGSAEATGFALGPDSAPFTVCGQIDPEQASQRSVDADYYRFEVRGTDPVNVRITLHAAAEETGALSLHLYQVDEGIPVFLAAGPLRLGRALVAGLELEPGTYWLAALGRYPLPDDVIPYSIQIERNTLSCPAAAGDPDHAEAGDGGSSRGNDVVSILYPAFELTGSGSDQPESTGLVLDGAAERAARHIRGVSAEVGSDGDDYLDRDTYLVTAGAATNELEIRLTWPDGDVDLDLFLFAAGDPDSDVSGGLGTTIGEQRDEVFTVAVLPGQAYWLWVGAFDDRTAGGATDLPVTYDLSLCPRALP